MNKLWYLALLGASTLYSCKEVPLIVDMSEPEWDTTYVTTPQVPQIKNILVEEPSGVQCVNCPAGAEMLHTANVSGPAAGRLVIVTLHAGDLTTPINKEGKVSSTDLRTDVGLQILSNILGGDIGKPCAAFDRLPIGNGGGLLDYRNKWYNMIDEVLANYNTTPINVELTTEKISDSKFAIEITVHYTQSLEGKQALSVYLTEDGIEDYQMFPTETKMYTFDHTFRASLLPFNGAEILSDLSTKEAGRVYKQRLILDVEDADALQQGWKPENMHVVAFVHKVDATDKKVYQTMQKKLVD